MNDRTYARWLLFYHVSCAVLLAIIAGIMVQSIVVLLLRDTR